MAKKIEKKEEDMFVGIQDPSELRKNILLGMKEAILFLKKYENLKEITKDKDEAFVKLLTIMKQLNAAVARLKSFFPRSKIHALGMPAPPKKADVKKEKPKVEEEDLHHASREMHKLESDLNKIEAKLAGL